jgi:hypothetical protein
MEDRRMKNACESLLYVSVVMTLVVASCIAGEMESPAAESDNLHYGYVMKFERNGGYLGRHDEFWIHPDGKILNSVGKTAWIPPESIRKWKGIILPVAAPKVKANPSFPSLCMDCYRYRITVYDEGKARVLSFDYPFAANENLSVKDIGWIYNILINLSWE